MEEGGNLATELYSKSSKNTEKAEMSKPKKTTSQAREAREGRGYRRGPPHTFPQRQQQRSEKANQQTRSYSFWPVWQHHTEMHWWGWESACRISRSVQNGRNKWGPRCVLSWVGGGIFCCTHFRGQFSPIHLQASQFIVPANSPVFLQGLIEIFSVFCSCPCACVFL